MPESKLYLLTIEEAAAGLAGGDFTSLSLTESCLEQSEKINAKINCFVRIEPEIARKQAQEADKRREIGETRGILDGVPYTLKDVFATKDSITTASSHMLEDWQAPYNSTVYQKLCDAGAVLLGKTNTDEFTMGGSTETSYFGVTKNPWNTERVSGGSSGGPAAAVAAHCGIFAIGTDTGGSIRQPASFCGVTGLRPTYGRVSRFGELAMASSLDQTGPLTKTVRDAAIVLEVLSGQDHLDATSSPEPVLTFNPEKKSIKGMKIGLPKEYFGEGINPEVEKLVRQAVKKLEEQGAEIKEVSLPLVEYGLAIYYIICPAEVSSNMARYDGIHFGHSVEKSDPENVTDLFDVYSKSRASGLGAEVKRRIILGSHVLSSGYYDAYYNKAQKARQAVSNQFSEVFKEVDILAAPVCPNPAFKIGEHVGDPLAMYKEDILTVLVNVARIAGISVPCGFVEELPVGLQLMSATFKEGDILNAGAVFQEVTNHHKKIPPILTEQ